MVLRKNIVYWSFCALGSKSGLSGDSDFKVRLFFQGRHRLTGVVSGRESKDWGSHIVLYSL